jgi:hypothetical protein
VARAEAPHQPGDIAVGAEPRLRTPPVGSQAALRLPRQELWPSGRQVVRRITGTSIGQFFTDEIAGPLGADFQIGLPEMDFPRAPASSLAISLGPPREQG